MELESVTLKLPRELLSGAQRVASAREVTIGHMVRQLLKREVDRQLASKDITTVSEGLISAVETLLARDIADANDWDDMAERLRPHGYVFRSHEGDLVLFKISCGTRICTGSELGFSYASLVKRFGQNMPTKPVKKASNGVMPAGRLDPTRHELLSTLFAAARNWPDLINRLAIEGMELRPLGVGLGIHIAATGRHLCNSGTVGVRYQTLASRFGAAMPGHPIDAP
jgi:hypothetical protein